MRTIFLVTKEEVGKARQLEEKLIALPSFTGILFAGVWVDPVNDLRTEPIYMVFIGCSHHIEPETIKSLVHHHLKEEVESGMLIQVQVHRGVIRK